MEEGRRNQLKWEGDRDVTDEWCAWAGDLTPRPPGGYPGERPGLTPRGGDSDTKMG